ncbi:4-(cytidine 5'-diphospho)-2-C-methyl-D-erythritol kinase [Roseomonas marmotae]|uniref:4-diphosphocytidyl-2-C-methyl-D-erythritol kinase n=1 Tax=Roseomonas marmotae TaxID=2768161 RepID=A0ABS3K7R5_9PROT|nr:4-(cytidine 5'-diphospho)-2-C-methyl-D-erythritol kinase [Roseomonas marmotae]MBO1073516.1 4-(cytidine 5'-diphospho)-2-C-methyl-D-erythritol kinase [Roseomonas marmotae]QTI80295.1 4-(cytidine 5'-diphospho)-2-C-methyl-D-erythritol kinase [Roseomonas marmotae]
MSGAAAAGAEEAAPAKVNLHLHVTGRRADGYHLLDSLVVFAGAGDRLRLEPAPGLSLVLEGPEGAALAAEPDNLVLRSARLLAEHAGIRPHGRLRLEKNLPVASGIGGGSADAAAALRLLDHAWGLRLEPPALAALAARLGADVPVCLENRPRRMQGVGEVLSDAPALPDCGMVLANPRLALPTPAVFRARRGDGTPPATLPAGWADARAMARDLLACRNDLEEAAIGLCPAVAEVLTALRALPGCLLARMSGSGATCFGLFPSASQAAHAAELLPKAWWRWGGGLYDPGRAAYSAQAGGA